MNTYLFPWYADGVCGIRSVVAKSYESSEEKIKSMYLLIYDDLDDLQDYDDFCIELDEKYGVCLGKAVEINEFM